MNFIVVFEGMTSYHTCTLLQQCIQFAVEVTVTHVPHIDKLIHYIITLKSVYFNHYENHYSFSVCYCTHELLMVSCLHIIQQ